ncbi:MAG: NADH-quinone oxidoreductase subunit J, partial [Phycisphaerae bacterium]|nr:NADH-quinone oxidoreductase subunit J [Phycisphaerae bacterium]
MSTTMLYTICVLGAVGLYLLVRPSRGRTNRERGLTAAGVLLGLGAFAGLLVAAAERVGPPETRPELFFTIFSLIALAAAVRMITHSRPVYSALYFVLVVLASAGLFLLLQAEFMAFALIIVYAGAILITYMFVLMLAQQAPTADDDRGQPEYDLNPREPAAGVIVGFIVLALLSRMALDGTAALDPPPTPVEARQAAWSELEQLPGRVLEHAGSD